MPATTLALSAHQQAALVALMIRPLTTRELGKAVGTTRGTGSLLQVLYQRGLVRYVGGRGVRPGKGQWQITDFGKAIAVAVPVRETSR